ncbi:hypothetical protein ACFVQ4_05520 [Streptomyces laurentii]|uniref:hypothetical protein n=1 Tax=Streptomyces laurentii TaxID=39478 RepID=UPI00368B7939
MSNETSSTACPPAGPWDTDHRVRPGEESTTQAGVTTESDGWCGSPSGQHLRRGAARRGRGLGTKEIPPLEGEATPTRKIIYATVSLTSAALFAVGTAGTAAADIDFETVTYAEPQTNAFFSLTAGSIED